MEALQYIYTSWKNGDSTEKGYMIYSRSEGITESECSAIKDAMQYLAPKELTLTPTPQEIADTFPYAFSYFILPTGRGCVAQSTYLGKDYSGRYGNYIIYALIFNINDLPCRPAEFFAEPYIKTAMTQEELNAPSPVPPLPPLHISKFASIINDEQLNEFLFDKEEAFAQLISMILAARDANIPFYLNDTRENLVLWSAAVQRMLPSRLAQKFTFNTYIGDHEAMRSPRAQEEGLNFHIIGVRPDANYFNYATESKSNRHIVMDFIGGHMTNGVIPTSYAKAMAASMAFDCEEVDSFSKFINSTSFNEINGHLQDAYLYYNLLKNDAFEFTENNLNAILLFGSAYCSEFDNSDIGSKLLIKYQDGEWLLNPQLLTLFWKFVCKYAGFMIFTLYDLFTDTLYQLASETSEPCTELDSLIQTIKEATPQQYRDYLDYLNTTNSVERLLLCLSGHNNLFTNSFFITWLLQSYSLNNGLSSDQPISKVLKTLLKNLTKINGCEKYILEILLTTSDKQALFEDILSIFMATLLNPIQLDQLCAKYTEVTENLTDRQLNRFEQLLLKTPGALPIATRLCAEKISSSQNPKDEFWRFYENLNSHTTVNSEFSIDPLILACINNVDAKNLENVALDILRKIDVSLITDSETIKSLTNIVNDCSIKALSKMNMDFLQKVCQIRATIGKDGLEKIKAVCVGQILENSNSKQKCPINLSGELAQADVNLRFFNKSDYETYIKNYFKEYLALVQVTEDIPVLLNIFYHDRYFSNFIDTYISTLKKMHKKAAEKWKSILGWTCVYVITSETKELTAKEFHKPVVRYLRSLDEKELLIIRQFMIQDVSPSRCDCLLDEVRRKEGLSKKISNLFRRK